MREDVLAARARYHGGKLRHGERAQEGIEAARNPDSEEEPRVGKLRGDLSRRAQDACADGVAYGNGQPEAYAKHPEKTAAPLFNGKALMRGLQGLSPFILWRFTGGRAR
jgi:hypothetical protein